MANYILPPWVAVHRSRRSEVVKYNDHEAHEGCSGSLIIVEVIGTTEIRKAHAELIAAVHDLLNACKDTLTEMRAYNAESEFDESCPMKPTFDQLKAAIARAEMKEITDV